MNTPRRSSPGRKLPMIAVAGLVAVAVPAVGAYAAAGHPGAGSARPAAAAPAAPVTSAPAPKVTPYTPPAAPSGAVAPMPTTITPSSAFAVQVDATGRKPMDGTWPSAQDVFTLAELRQVLPQLSALTPSGCSTGDRPGGGATTKPTTCTLTLTMNGERSDDRSKLVVDIRGFGLPATVGARWTKDLAADVKRSAARPGLYTFYRNGALGASASYTDGTTTKVLLQKGNVAGEIWFSGVGFTRLKSDYLASRNSYRTTIVPALVRLLATKLDPGKATS
ncbi:hypothetical protein HJ588_13370 [Flexivirga sp. ID2601S]|uniref:DUF3558 domain-containing protein n=1 Tax=Flexivirga aerilata TaxID=1656889 RepID=A0A849AK98_9MICO|nr:hypothetical protein [Flexivirga aerilata]NNG40257.1 hypothetical protein [Flexivirga aerilata]